jgi:hypothetical protein
MAAATFALVSAGHNRLVYQVTTDGTATAGTLPALGGASPDLVTDSQLGPVQRCALAFANGFGSLPAGAMTQANARAIWLSVGNAAIAGPTLATCQCRINGQTSGVDTWDVDANVDGGGHPNIVVTPFGATAGIAILEIRAPGVIGD